MSSWKRLQTCAALAACWVFVIPPQCLRAQQLASTPVGPSSQLVRDVELDADGTLRGRVVTSQGNGIAQAAVLVQQRGRSVVETRTDVDGGFAVPSLRGGMYQVNVADQVSQVRAWSHRTAPPAAHTGVLLVASEDVLRGQGCTDGSCTGVGGIGGGPFAFLLNPWVIGGIIAAAIAIPLALHDDDDDAS